jgi:hypothetical protein
MMNTKIPTVDNSRCGSLRLFCATAFAIVTAGFCIAAAFAQEPSTDRRNPTPLTSNSVEGEYDGEATVHYYRFVANKGELKTTLTASTQRYSVNVDLELLDENYRQLDRVGVTANEAGRTETNVHRFVRRQPVILKVSMPADKDIKHLKYEIELAGPVEFEGGASGPGASGVTATTTAQTATVAGDRLCLPASGTLVLTIASGEKYEIDLSQVTKAAIK